MSNEELKQQIVELGPWHIDIDVGPAVSTAAVLERQWESEGRVDTLPTFISPRRVFDRTLKAIYPAGLEGRTLLDCACNCGAYCFWARDLGGGPTYGFDIREHWIKQARFLKQNRPGGNDDMRFEVGDVCDLPKAGLAPFDIVLFQGIFYHLPDPVTVLRGAANLSKDLIVVDTAIRTGLPDGMLSIGRDSTETLMTGVHGLAWYPTGPGVIQSLLNWLGFSETRVISWRANQTTRQGKTGIGRIRVFGSRVPGRLDPLTAVTEPQLRDRQGGGMRDRQEKAKARNPSPE